MSGSQKDAFFTAAHTVPKKIATRFLCQPKRIVTDPLVDCGPIPTVMTKFANDTLLFTTSKASTIICLNGTQRIGKVCIIWLQHIQFLIKSAKWALNMECKTKKKWNGVFKWVNVGAHDKYWPTRKHGNSLNGKCKSQLRRFIATYTHTFQITVDKSHFSWNKWSLCDTYFCVVYI